MTVDRLHGEPLSFDRSRLERDAPRAARGLLGALLVRHGHQGRVVARIVEVEAYRQDDPASHSHGGPTPRTEPMFARAGTAYVYRSYGMHWCLNISAEVEGIGAAVLLRAATVLEGHDTVRSRRPTARSDAHLLRGPGNLASGLDVDAARHDGGDLVAGVAGLALADDGWRPGAGSVVATPRVGIRHAPDVPWRFHLAGVPQVSAYRRSPRAAPPPSL